MHRKPVSSSLLGCLRFLVYLSVLPVVTSEAAHAQQVENLKWCANEGQVFSFDLAIGGCTAVIQSGKESRRNLAKAFMNRGRAHAGKRDFTSAIRDFDEAIRIDGNYALAYLQRGNFFLSQDEYDRALSEYDKALLLEPKNQEVIKSRVSAQKAKADRGFDEQKEKELVADALRQLNLFGEAFSKVQAEYVTEPDDWQLVENAVAGMKTLVPEIDVKSICGARWMSVGPYQALMCFGEIFENTIKRMGPKPSAEQLVSKAVEGMVERLDALSTYIDAKSLAAQKSGQAAAGIGLEITQRGGTIEIVAPLSGSPADRSTIRGGDTLTRIDGEPTRGLTLQQTVEKLRGPIGSQVRLTLIKGGGDKEVELVLTREVILVPSVRSQAIDDVGYLRITKFDEQTPKKVEEAMNSLRLQVSPHRLKGFIVDLRNNSGGLFKEAISVADCFLEMGEIVTTRGREKAERFSARPGDLTAQKPILVLVNGGTASGAEIVAGALQDHRRATIVGTRTFGMGSVQTIIPLGEGKGALHLTTSRHFTPSGRSVDGQGLSPDIEVVQDDPTKSTSPQRQGESPDSASGKQGVALQSYVPPDGKSDRALHLAVDLLRGVEKHPAFAPDGHK